ncbi:MAG: TonB-dependent receptor [Gammaproteobacteria bacterium]|nr:TonB-dependent receptor [Gammaproteobacteria bacterium]
MLNKKHFTPGQLIRLVLATFVCLCTSAQAEEAQQLPEITVEGEVVASPAAYPVDLEKAPVTTPDTAALLERAPGANVNRNGPLTGIAQYRGMYADQINVLVNGIHINTGGPNGMDPALSYVPRAQLESLEVIRGIAPVSSGLETIGGTMKANVRTSHFTASDSFSPDVDVTLGGATVDSSWSASGFGALSNKNHRMHVYGSKENGDDYEIPGGKVRPSEYDRENGGIGYGFQRSGHELGLNYRHNRTDDTGTPSLPMDIDYIETDILESEYGGTFGKYDVHGQLFYTDVDHKMNNYGLRNPPMPTMTRQNKATSDGLGYRADVGFALGTGHLLLGTDGQFDSHDATVTDPLNNPNFLVQAYNNVDRNAFGVFAEWEGSVASDWNMQFGGRYTRVESSSGNVSHFMAGMNPAINTLQTRFNTANKDNNQDNFDLVTKLDHALSSQLSFNIEGGIKNRAPSYQQLYLWVPLQSTNGLADGHNYVGDINLDSETAYEVGLGLDWNSPRVYASPRVFYRKVNDYIQGTPATDPTVIMVSTANGDPDPLQWDNVDAILYGIDMDWGVTLGSNWSLDGVVSYVRGKRDDITDDLYRIAPLNGSATLSYSRSNWWVGLEGVAYARQNKVSKTNSESKSSGYGLANLRGGFEMTRNLVISAGVENIFDREYQNHLSGINRVAASDVPVGERVPGSGRSFFATLQYRFN